MNRVLLTVKEAAGMTGLTTNRIYELIKTGKLKGERLGEHQVRITRRALMKFLGEEEPEPSTPARPPGLWVNLEELDPARVGEAVIAFMAALRKTAV